MGSAAAASEYPAVLRRFQLLRLLCVQSDDDEVAFHLAARSAEYHQGIHDADGRASGARLYLPGAERVWHLLSRQDHDRHLLVHRDLLSQRNTVGLSLFPLHAHTQSSARDGCITGTADWSCGRCRGVLAWHREWCRQAHVAGWYLVAGDIRSWTGDPRCAGPRRYRRSRQCR